jgi:peptidyl-prolyl cis-trans isomerase C
MTTAPLETGCTVKPAINAKPKAVSVNGVLISRAAIGRETQNHPATKPIEAWQAAARALVTRELLLQEARRIGLAPEPACDADGRRETDEATCRRYHAQNAGRFRTPDLHEASHILLPLAGNASAAETGAAEGAAAAIIDAIGCDPTRFAALASANSVCPSRDVGGNLGQIGRGQTVPEFEAALPGLPVGRVAPAPVRSRYGLHIVRVERRIEGRSLPFEAVGSRIADFLSDRVRMVAERQYLGILAGRAKIEGIAFEASVTPLVQ